MKKIGLCLLCFAAFLLVMCSTKQPEKKTESILRIGVEQEFENLNPLIKTMYVTSYSYDMVGRTLMTLDRDLQWVPVICKDIPSIENGQAEFFTEKGVKKIKATWEIKENVKWGDGQPVTGHDVAFTHTVALNDNIAIPDKETYADVERIEVDPDNPKKFTFYHTKAKWDFYQKGQFFILPKHLEEPVYQKYGNEKEGYEKNSLYSANPTNPGLYNGPYVIEELKLGSHITFTPNKHFYGQKPNIDKIIIKLIPNTATLEANILSKNIDMIANLALPFDQALSFEKRVSSSDLPYNVNYKTGLIYEHIEMQQNNPILKDMRVRKALIHGINRQELVNTIYSGKLSVAHCDLSPIDPWFTDDPSKIVMYDFDRKKSKDLLEQAGYKMNKTDGYYYKKGKKLSLQIMTTANNKTRELVESYLQEQWKKIGIEITIKNEPPRVFFGETVRKSKFPALAMFAWISLPYNNPRSMFHTSQIPSEANSFSGQNCSRWVNKTITNLIDEMDTTFVESRRIELRHKMLYQYTNDMPVIPLYYRTDISVTPKNLTGYKLTGTLFSATGHVELWKLEETKG